MHSDSRLLMGAAAFPFAFALAIPSIGRAQDRATRCRALDIGSRNGRHLERVPEEIMDDVLAKLATIVG